MGFKTMGLDEITQGVSLLQRSRGGAPGLNQLLDIWKKRSIQQMTERQWVVREGGNQECRVS